ncbi:energy-coupling factor transporter ATPase [uncultured Ellagibacter sp.]|uniref:ABC transporter ATP-binding protein n=1 Tax=uncultured Ellagibacter sp. TaxID=2137580 RepID=UPI002610F6B9|nr:energy-coupling factor transporter ATPase [uncultured Ellagibacter sp.]
MAHFAIEQLTFAYPGADRRALDGVSLEIEQGSYVVICGKSGCGKTTLLRHLKSVLTPHGERTGRVLFEGVPLEEVSQRDQSAKIGFVMQNPDAQIVTDKVWHELAFGLESLGCDKDSMRFRVAEMASYFGIESWFHKDVRDLSGGQKQLLNLASIMAMRPSALILDEPTSQLDPIAASDFLNTVRKINLELGVTVILTEHRLEEVFACADKVVVMDRGEIVSVGAPREVALSLHASGNDMMSALPAPLRIFYGVEAAREVGLGKASPDKATPEKAESPDAPLTVREGRRWLSRVASDDCAQRDAIPADAPLDAVEHPVLSLKEVWFRYDRDLPDVLRGASLDVAPGSILAIMGGNGAGKSTLLRVACGISKPYRGTVRVFGRKLKDWKAGSLFDGCLALLPQDPQNLFVKKTVREDLAEMLASSRLPEADRALRIEHVIDVTDIESLLDKHPFDLSGGEQQRAALAKVLLTDPKILLLDEPTKGIDAFFKRQFASVLDDLKHDGVAIVMVSHDIEFCARHADAVAMMFDGEIVAQSTPRTFFSSNSFYTTAANRMSRHVFPRAITDEDVIGQCMLR